MLLPRVLGDASDVCNDGNDKTSSSRTRTICWKEYGCSTQTKASEFGNSAKIIDPRSWLGKRVIAFLHSEYISEHPQEQNEGD